VTSTPLSNEKSQHEAPRAPSRNIFEDPAIAAAAQNDPFARWVIGHWRTILGVLVALAAGMLGYHRFTSVALEKRSAATSVLNSVQESYAQLLAKDEALVSLKGDEAAATDPAQKEKVKKEIESTIREVDQLRDKVTLMVDSLDVTPPYGHLKDLYRGLLASRLKDYDKTQGLLAAHSWEEVGKPDSSERFIAELVTYGLARSLIESDAHREFARTHLVGLADRGSFAAVQAATTLSLIAQTDAEKAQAQELVAKLRVKFPSQQRYLSTGDSES
jgi:hypothetical protein